MSNGVHVRKGQWKNGKVVTTIDSVNLNKMLIDIQSRVLEIIENMMHEGNIDINASALRHTISVRVPSHSECKILLWIFIPSLIYTVASLTWLLVCFLGG